MNPSHYPRPQWNRDSSTEDPDPLDPQDFGFLDPDPDPQKYAFKISTKATKKIFTPKIQIWTFEKGETIKISSFLNGLSSFRIKTSEKIKQKIWKLFVVKKNQ